MPIFTIEVKHDTQHRKWHALSVRTKVPMDYTDAYPYLEQYARDNQMNVDMVAMRIVQESGAIVHIFHSSATENRRVQ